MSYNGVPEQWQAGRARYREVMDSIPEDIFESPPPPPTPLGQVAAAVQGYFPYFLVVLAVILIYRLIFN